MKKIANQKGFTLVELLVVIVIIGILAVALLPNILGAPGKARDAAVKTDVNSIITALAAADAEGNLQPLATINASEGCMTDPTAYVITGSLADYMPGGLMPEHNGWGVNTLDCDSNPDTIDTDYYLEITDDGTDSEDRIVVAGPNEEGAGNTDDGAVDGAATVGAAITGVTDGDTYASSL